MTEFEKLKIEHEALKGYFSRYLRGILMWDIPEELKEKINNQIKELKNSK